MVGIGKYLTSLHVFIHNSKSDTKCSKKEKQGKKRAVKKEENWLLVVLLTLDCPVFLSLAR